MPLLCGVEGGNIVEVIYKRLALGAIFITLPIIIILTNLELVAFNKNFYNAKYDKYQVVENTGIKKDELMEVTHELLSYLRGERNDLKIYANVLGENRLVFDERDRAHMVDVQVLFIKGTLLRNISSIVFIIGFIYLIFIKKYRREAVRMLLNSIITTAILIILLAIIISTDFSKYFDIFHYIFFDNDLWRLDPNKSILINLVPLGFFKDIVVKLGLNISISFALITLISIWYLRKNKSTIKYKIL